jgi:hypothetical protein
VVFQSAGIKARGRCLLVSPRLLLVPDSLRPPIAHFCFPLPPHPKTPAYSSEGQSRGRPFSGLPTRVTCPARIRPTSTSRIFSQHVQAQSEHAWTLQRDGFTPAHPRSSQAPASRPGQKVPNVLPTLLRFVAACTQLSLLSTIAQYYTTKHNREIADSAGR